MLQYGKILRKSLHHLYKTPVIYVPVLVSILLFFGLALLIFLEGLLFIALFPSVMSGNIGILSSFPAMSFIAFSVAIDMIVLFCIRAYAEGLQYGVFKDVVIKGKSSSKAMWSYGKGFFKRILKVDIIIALFEAVPVIALSLVVYLGFSMDRVVGMILAAISILLMIAYLLILVFFFFFVRPIIVSTAKNISAAEIIRMSYKYSMQHAKKVIIVLLIMIAVTAAVTIILMLGGIPIGIISAIIPRMGIAGAALGTGISILYQMLSIVARFVMGVFQQIFLFSAYFAEDKN
ncbi:hypothetical protein GF351_03680 [Candidatus Woesearchaeota archaeon]|nr:hypothetical protein [Candidatus Woesearchaeota archaeon]